MNRFQICYDIYDSGYLVHTNSSDLRFPLRVRGFFYIEHNATLGNPGSSVRIVACHGWEKRPACTSQF
jgi:hypothetical protein